MPPAGIPPTSKTKWGKKNRQCAGSLQNYFFFHHLCPWPAEGAFCFFLALPILCLQWAVPHPPWGVISPTLSPLYFIGIQEGINSLMFIFTRMTKWSWKVYLTDMVVPWVSVTRYIFFKLCSRSEEHSYMEPQQFWFITYTRKQFPNPMHRNWWQLHSRFRHTT